MLTRISHTPPIMATYRTKSIGENGDLDAQRSAATPPLKIAIFSNIFSTLRSLITAVYGISGLTKLTCQILILGTIAGVLPAIWLHQLAAAEPSAINEESSAEAARPSLNLPAYTSQQEAIEEARALYFRAADNGDYTEEGKAFLVKLLAIYPHHQVLRGYSASFRVLEGRDGWWPPARKTAVDEGLAELDKIITEDAKNAEVLFLRGSLGFHLPFFFGRKEQAIKDLKECGQIIAAAPKGAFSDVFIEQAAPFLIDKGLSSNEENGALQSLVNP